jgi:hypothetical protein
MKEKTVKSSNPVNIGKNYRNFSISDKVFPALKKRILEHKIGDEVSFTVTGKVISIGEEVYDWTSSGEKVMNVLEVKIKKIKL